MEHGLDSPLSAIEHNCLEKSSITPNMANFPDEVATQANENKSTLQSPKINGDVRQDVPEYVQSDPFDDTYSSESDVLVIDESVPKQKKKGRRRNKKGEKKVSDSPQECVNSENSVTDCESKVDDKQEVHNNQILGSNKSAVQPSEVPSNVSEENPLVVSNKITEENFQADSCDSANSKEKATETHTNYDSIAPSANNNLDLITHSNPFFHESLFELSQLHHSSNCEAVPDVPYTQQTVKPVKPKPKLKEYAQYLGLQPAVQFKCPKCGKSGFESLVTLQEHFLNCTAIHPVEKSTEGENVSGFKLTRKVFLCSACGTYYENWNLYIHMLEHHKRYICLYCLGMFSVLEDLCHHIESRHNLEPGIKHSLEEFYNTYNEPCYVICCECNQQFNEGENFFYHNCVSSKVKNKKVKQVIAPENHVTGDFGTLPNDTENDNHSTKSQEDENKKPDSELSEHKDSKSPCDSPLHNTSKIGVQGDNNDKQSSDDLDASNNSDSDSCKSDDNLNNKPLELKVSDQVDEEKSDDDTPINAENIKNTCENESLDSFIAGEANEDNSANTDTMEDEFKQDSSVETRKVPKLSLKLPKMDVYQQPAEDSDDSEKANAEVDNIESEPENEQLNEHHISGTEEELGKILFTYTCLLNFLSRYKLNILRQKILL